jgi:hypothetical protein
MGIWQKWNEAHQRHVAQHGGMLEQSARRKAAKHEAKAAKPFSRTGKHVRKADRYRIVEADRKVKRQDPHSTPDPLRGFEG